MLQSGWRCWAVLCFAMFRDCRDVSRRLRCGVVPESAESWRRRVPFLQVFCDSDDSDDSAVSIQASSMGMPRLVAMFEAVVLRA